MATPGARRRRPTVLVVDDSRLIRRMVHDYLGERGYDVEQAEDGRDALDRLRSLRPDIIVSDILMPNVDGWALFDEVRRRPSTAGVPFVFLTVERDLPSRLRGFRVGADDYVTKPFEVEELHVRIERLLGRTKAAGVSGLGDALLAGTLEHLSLSDLLQILAMNGRDCVVRLQASDTLGEIHFRGGEIVHATAGRAQGLKALYRMMVWADAVFRVEPAGQPTRERSIEGATSNVLMDGMVALDEWNRWSACLPDPATTLALADDARDRLEGANVRPAEFDVLSRSKQGTNVAQILEESPLPDGQLAQAIHELIDRGIVQPQV